MSSNDKPKVVVGTIGSEHNALRCSLAASILLATLSSFEPQVPNRKVKVGDTYLCNFSGMRLVVKAVTATGIVASQNVYMAHSNTDMNVTYNQLRQGYTKQVTE